MKKALKSWSGMRKYLEKEMLAEPLKGKVRYNCTTYPGMDGCHIFEIFIDNKLFKQFSWETVNTYFVEKNYVEKSRPLTISDYWQGFWDLLDEHPMEMRTEYTDDEFAEALEKYRNSDIQECIQSSNLLVKMFAILDRRIGRRTLDKLAEDIENEADWIQEIYRFRLQAL